MRVRAKKHVEVPTKVKEFIDRALAASSHDLPGVLEGFKWVYEKGDFYHWLSLFNRFDETLEAILKDRKDVSLEGVPEPHGTPFPSRSVLAILRVSTTILENCSNKHLYQSHEHLSSLLAAPDKEVVEAALQTLVAFLRKTHGSSVRWHGSSDLSSRLLALSQGWGVKELGINLAACTNSDETGVQHAVPAGCRLHFEFYEQDGSETAGGVRVIDLKRVDKYAESELEILFQLVKQFNVPEKLRFQLLTRISAARSFATLQGRRHTAAVRLLALHALFLANPSPEALGDFYTAEPDFVQDLVALLLAGAAVPEQLRTLVLRILAVQLIDRQRSSSVISAISSGGQSGLLSMLLHRPIASVADSSSKESGGFSMQFVEALLSLVGALSSSSSGCQALAEAGIVPALLPLIKDHNPEHIGLLGSAVRILEAFMDFSPPAATVFREIGGLSDMIDRLKLEVQAAPAATEAAETGSSIEAMQTDAPGSSAPAAASSPAGEGANSPTKSIPYNRRVLLKGLLRTIAMSSYAPGNTARPQEEDRATMYDCLRTILERAPEFGGGLFALAASVMADLTHHDPLCFPGLDAAGLPEAFIKAIKAGVLPSGEAVCCVPSTLVALCLNVKGLKRVEKSRALECLIPIFTTPNYLRALQFQGELPSVLGSSLDELMRHVSSLRTQVLEVAISIFDTLCQLGSTSPHAGPEQGSQETSSQQEAASAEGGAQPMDTADVSSKAPAHSDTSGAPSSPEKAADWHPYLSECIMHAARLLESLGANTDFATKFVDQGGLQLLLRLYTLRHLPPTFGSSSAAHALVAAVRVLNQAAASSVTSRVVEHLTGQLRTTLLLGMAIGVQGLQQLDPARRDEYMRNVSSLEGLTSLAAAISRTSIMMLSEMSRPSKFPGLTRVKLDEPVPAHALAVENNAPASAVIARLGDIQRIVLLQLALSGPAKREAEAAGADKKGDKVEPENEIAEMPDAPEMDMQEAGPEAGPLLQEAVAEAAAFHARVTAGLAEIPVTPKSPEPLPPGTKKKKSGEELAREVLAHFEVTVRSFYSSLSKAIHQHPRRRGDEGAPVSGPMRSAALYLGLVMKSSFERMAPLQAGAAAEASTSKGKGREADMSEKAAQDMSVWRLRYALALTDSLSSILFDARRNTCHCLLLNYWVRCGGLEAFIAAFRDVAAYLWRAVDEKEALAASQEVAMDTDDKKKQEQTGPLANAAKEVEKAEATLSTMLVLMANLVESPIMQASPGASHLLTIPLNEEDQETNAAWKTPENFLDSVKATILDAVLPVWSHPHMASTSIAGSGIVTHILKKCTEETMPLPAAAGRAAQRAEIAPDPAIVQQCVEMGFSETRVQEALRRIGHNSVEMAMEWLFSHPEDPSASAAPAAAAAENVTGVAQQLKLAPAQEIVKPPRAAPSTEQLVSGAVAVLEKVPVAAFSLADLLLSHAGKDTEREAAVMSSLLMLMRNDHKTLSNERLLAVAHLLAVLCDASPAMRLLGTTTGMVKIALSIIDAWMTHYSKAKLGDQQVPSPVPRYMDALLLIVNSSTAVIWKPQAAESAAGKPAAKEPQAVLQQEDTVMAGSQAPEPEPEPQQTGPCAPVPSESVQAGAPAQPSAAPAAAPDSDKKGKRVSFAAPQAKPEDISVLLPEREELITAEECEQAAQSAMALLRHLHAWGALYEAPPEGRGAGERLQMPDPLSTTQAVLQLLSSLTKRHSIALKVLSGKGPKLVLDLPAACFQPELEPSISAIMRHILEDPATLQAAMEAEIRATLNKQNPNPMQRGFAMGEGSLPVKQFLQNCSAVISREPKVFFEAVLATCSIKESGGRTMVILRKQKAAAKQSKPAEKEGLASKDRDGDDGSGPCQGPNQAAPAGGSTPGAATPSGPAQGSRGASGGAPGPSSGAGSGSERRHSSSDRRRSSGAGGPPAGDPGGGDPGKDPGKAGRTPRDRGDKGDKDPRTPGRSSKKVPGSFVEVIDCLVDLVLRFEGPYKKVADEGPSSMETDAPGGAKDVDMPASSQAQASSNGITAAQAAPGKAPEAASGQSKAIKAKDNEAAVQCMVLKMLTDFTLMYNACVGVILKRDAEGLGARGASPPVTPSFKSGTSGGRTMNSILFRHVMHTHLPVIPGPGGHDAAFQGMSEQTAMFLVAVCIRSAEGRKRIISEIVQTLSPHDEYTSPPASIPPQSALASIPFKHKPGYPPPYKVKAFVELAGSLLSAGAPKPAGSGQRAQTQGLSGEMLRSMRFAGVISALIGAMELLDPDHPQAAKSISTLLKPLEILTRPLPGHLRQGVDDPEMTPELESMFRDIRAQTSDRGRAPGSLPTPGELVQRHLAERDALAQASRSRNAERSGQYGEEPGESEAGPQAVQAAEQARQALGRGQGNLDPHGILSVESLMDEIIDRAYDEDDEMGGYSGGDSSGSEDEEMDSEDEEIDMGEDAEGDSQSEEIGMADRMDDGGSMDTDEEHDHDDEHPDHYNDEEDDDDDEDDDDGGQVEVIFDDDIEEEALLNQVMDDHEDPIMLEHGPVDGLEDEDHEGEGMEGEYDDEEGEGEEEEEDEDGEGHEEDFDGLEDIRGQLEPDDVVFEDEEIGLPMWPNLEGEGLGDEEAMPAMPRWLNVNLPRINGAPHGGPGAPGSGRIPGGIGRIGDGLGGRHAVEMVMSQLMNNPQFNNMHIEMRDSPGFQYRYRNASPRAQQPPAMQGPLGRHSLLQRPVLEPPTGSGDGRSETRLLRPLQPGPAGRDAQNPWGQEYLMVTGGVNGGGRQTISIGPRGIVLPSVNPGADFAADGARGGVPAGAGSSRPNNWSDNHLAPTAAESAALAGTLEQSLVNSLRSYAPPPDEDRGAGEPSMAPLGDGDAAQRHAAALAEQAQRLLQDTGPTATDMRMYNMMCTREAIAQAMREGLTYAEARTVANAEDSARTAAQAGNGMPQSVPPFREMMQRLDRAREEVEGLQEQARSEQASRMTASHTLLQEAYRAIGTSGGRELPRPPRAARREMQERDAAGMEQQLPVYSRVQGLRRRLEATINSLRDIEHSTGPPPSEQVLSGFREVTELVQQAAAAVDEFLSSTNRPPRPTAGTREDAARHATLSHLERIPGRLRRSAQQLTEEMTHHHRMPRPPPGALPIAGREDYERRRAIMWYEMLMALWQQAQSEIVDALRALLECEGRTERSPEEREAARQRVTQHVTERLRERHAGEGGEAAARSFEEFMERTFPRLSEGAGPSQDQQAQAAAQPPTSPGPGQGPQPPQAEPSAGPESSSARPGSASRPPQLQVPATEQALGLSTPAAAPAQAALPPNNRASRNAPRQRAVRPQEGQDGSGVTDTPYAQLPPLPPWMAEDNAGLDEVVQQARAALHQTRDQAGAATTALRERLQELQARAEQSSEAAGAQPPLRFRRIPAPPLPVLPPGPERPRTRSQRQESSPAQPAEPAQPAQAAARPVQQPIGADALNQALGAAMGDASRAEAPASQPAAAPSNQGQPQPPSMPQLGNVVERVAGLSGSVPRWASGNLDAPPSSAAPAPSAAPPPAPIDADLFSSAMSAAMSSMGQQPQQQQQGQGSIQGADSVGQAAQQQTPAGDPMETIQDGEASAQPMETSLAAPAQQEDTAGPSEPASSSAEAAGPSAPPEDEGVEPVDPEFLAALPEELQQEVLESRRREIQARRNAREREEAQRAAAASGAAPEGGPAELDLATTIASFPPEVREEVLLGASEDILAQLPPAILAEAQALRQRSGARFATAMGAVPPAARAPPPGFQQALGGATRQEALLRHLRARGDPAGAPEYCSELNEQRAGDRLKQDLINLAGKRLVDDRQLLVLLSQLRLNSPQAKPQLQRVIYNLGQHHDTLRALLRLALALLRFPLSPDEAEPASEEEQSSAPRSLRDALQSAGQGSSEGAAGKEGNVFAQLGLLGRSNKAVPQALTRRALELLTYMAKHHVRVAREMLSIRVPTPEEQAQLIDQKPDPKGKGRWRAIDDEVDGILALDVPLELLGKPICKRSSAHLEAALHLIEVTLNSAKAYLSHESPTAHVTVLESMQEMLLQEEMAEEMQTDSGAAEEQPLSAPREGAASVADRLRPTSGGQAGGSTPSQATSAVAAARERIRKRLKRSELTRIKQTVPDVKALNQDLLRQLPGLLGQRGVSDLACARAAACIKLAVQCAPDFKPLMLQELERELQGLIQPMLHELQSLTAAKEGHSTAMNVGAGVLGSRILQILEVTSAIVIPPPPKRTPYSEEPEKKAPEVEPQDLAFLEELAGRTEQLWGALSRTISDVEAHVARSQSAAPEAAAAAPGTRMLPPGVLQVLPLLKAFFVLCEARTAHLPAPAGAAGARRAASLDISRGASMDVLELISQPSAALSTAPEKAVAEAHLPFLRFAERHRRLLNMLLHQSPALLEGPLACLMRVPRLIDFDNKRAYFRTRIRGERERYGASLRIHVRREHVFEDSFHQLRAKTPAEMQGKLNVAFHGEEGIDAGGVSREWYQVMAREIFNPNFSLFVPVPMGGSTFQPNPNSVVQNDEARGTNHLDFFKFVGRVVGKALHDGQYIDAYFTRSFYKHMLGQPLTYQDIEAVDPEYYKNLRWMLENDINDVLDLTFTEEVDYFGAVEMVELKPGGSSIKVTNENKREYVDLVAEHRMTTAIRAQTQAFLKGYWEMVPKDLISIFNDSELELMVCGLPEIDTDDLRGNTEYTGYTPSSAVVQYFWEVVRELDKEDLALLIQFVTGTSKVPLDGFKALQGIGGPQRFQIHKAYGPQQRLPAAHTCFNQLDLIEYESKEALKERLMLALHEGAEGFGFG